MAAGRGRKRRRGPPPPATAAPPGPGPHVRGGRPHVPASGPGTWYLAVRPNAAPGHGRHVRRVSSTFLWPDRTPPLPAPPGPRPHVRGGRPHVRARGLGWYLARRYCSAWRWPARAHGPSARPWPGWEAGGRLHVRLAGSHARGWAWPVTSGRRGRAGTCVGRLPYFCSAHRQSSATVVLHSSCAAPCPALFASSVCGPLTAAYSLAMCACLAVSVFPWTLNTRTPVGLSGHVGCQGRYQGWNISIYLHSSGSALGAFAVRPTSQDPCCRWWPASSCAVRRELTPD